LFEPPTKGGVFGYLRMKKKKKKGEEAKESRSQPPKTPLRWAGLDLKKKRAEVEKLLNLC